MCVATLTTTNWRFYLFCVVQQHSKLLYSTFDVTSIVLARAKSALLPDAIVNSRKFLYTTQNQQFSLISWAYASCWHGAGRRCMHASATAHCTRCTRRRGFNRAGCIAQFDCVLRSRIEIFEIRIVSIVQIRLLLSSRIWTKVEWTIFDLRCVFIFFVYCVYLCRCVLSFLFNKRIPNFYPSVIAMLYEQIHWLLSFCPHL